MAPDDDNDDDDGQRGMIETETANYVLNPLPERVRNESREADPIHNDLLTGTTEDAFHDLHVVVKRDPVTDFNCPYRK